MCYPCTRCGACGKFDKGSPLYTPAPEVPCLKCGETVDLETGVCTVCGAPAFAPAGQESPEAARRAIVPACQRSE